MEFGYDYRMTVSYDVTVDETNAYHDKVVNIAINSDKVDNPQNGITLLPVEKMDLSGTVKNPEEEVVVGEKVELYAANGTTKLAEATTDEEGKFLFDDVTLPTGTYFLKVDDSTNAVFTKEISVTEGTDLTENITLEAGFNVALTLGTEEVNGVFSSEGSDADEAEYSAVLTSNGVEVAATTAAVVAGDDETLTFEFARIAAGEYTILVSGDFIEAKEFSVNVVDEDVIVTGRANPAGKISGTTVPVLSTVTLVDAEGNIVGTTVSDESGDYAFGGLAVRTYTVKFAADGYVADEIENVEVTVDNDTESTDITLEAVTTTGDFQGFVRTTGTLAPAEGAVITLYAIAVEGKEAGEEVVATAVAADGSYSFTGLTAGSYRVVIREEGSHETYTTTLEIAAGDDLSNVNYKLEVGGNASLNVVVKDGEGAAVNVAAGSLILADEYADELTGTEGIYANDAEASDITIEDLAAGTYHLTITVDGYVPVDQLVTIAKSEAKEIEITLVDEADAYDVSFRVFDETSADLQNAVIVAFNANGNYIKKAVTDENGAATITGLVDGNYTFHVYVNGYLVAVRNTVVNGDDVVVPVIQLVQY